MAVDPGRPPDVDGDQAPPVLAPLLQDVDRGAGAVERHAEVPQDAAPVAPQRHRRAAGARRVRRLGDAHLMPVGQ
ncbi:hypothetical protein [Actinomadura sp. 7K507]|uniref:hypothetical protein n=1 Tax=Actinomadura sp. 7K507 TaxID=2530365 RepID=UPI0010458536|nr:hypothetical protein [Actinomadura sp. 7K507]TDC95319.1 hypothetical protein E1285_07190 [Actinomadura sp. 7K507]